MIFLDFDGTLVDLWPRYYEVFSNLSGFKEISLEIYKKDKKLLLDDEKLASLYKIKLPNQYFRMKREALESQKFLELDEILIPKKQYEILKKKEIIILSKRRNPKMLSWQLMKLGINLPYQTLSDNESKKEWIKLNFPTGDHIIIGDSILDLEAGKLENVTPFMVESGLGTKDTFDQQNLKYKLFRDLSEIITKI